MTAVRVLACALATAMAGCSVPPKGGFDEVSRAADERTGHSVHWFQGTPEDAQVAERVRDLLADELSLDAAVQVALLNNRSLQATYEDLGVAQSDLVRAGLLRNPVLLGSSRFPDRPPFATNLEFEVMQDFLGLLLLPARKRVASRAFEAAQADAIAAVLDLVAEVKTGYLRLQASGQRAQVLAVVVEASQASTDLARKQREAGNVSELDLVRREVVHERTLLSRARAQLEAAGLRERLARLLGVWGEDALLKVPPRLPDLPTAEPDLARLEPLAMERRPELAMLRARTQARVTALGMAQGLGRLGMVDVGGVLERETDGQHVAGPQLQVELPIFDQGQVRVAHGEAELRRAVRRWEERAIEIRSEVREGCERLVLARRMVDRLREVVLPLHERVVGQAQKHQGAMLIGVFELLSAKRDEVEMYLEYVDAVQDYWIARVDLEHAIGGPLPGASAPASIRGDEK